MHKQLRLLEKPKIYLKSALKLFKNYNTKNDNNYSLFQGGKKLAFTFYQERSSQVTDNTYFF